MIGLPIFGDYWDMPLSEPVRLRTGEILFTLDDARSAAAGARPDANAFSFGEGPPPRRKDRRIGRCEDGN